MALSFIIDFTIFLFFCGVLVKSSSYLLQSLIKIASFLKFNEFSVGFILMAISTSLPELFVGISSALNGTPVLVLGTVIGSNILDLTVVIGIVTLLAKGIRIESKIVKKDMFYMIFILFVPVILMLDHYLWQFLGFFPTMEKGLSRGDGLILIGVFGIYIWKLLMQEKRFRKALTIFTRGDVIKYFILFLASLFLLMLSSELLVEYATILSAELLIPPIFMGIFLISLGTSLPELMFEAKAVISRHQEMAVGDLIGSVVTNSTLVLGVTAIIHPISANVLIYFSSTVFLILIAFVFLTFMESESGLSWKEGVSLIMMYVFFIALETFIK